MTTYLLVHGEWHAAWCWAKLSPLLSGSGHTVLAPDMPGHGEDRTPLADLTTASSLDSLVRLVDQQPEPVVAVGHSSGGVLISPLADLRPRRVRALVYVSAFLLPPGSSPSEIMRRDTESILADHIVADGQVTYLTPESARQVFYHDCSETDAEWAGRMIEPERRVNAMSVREPESTREGPAIDVPRFFVHCLSDRALGPVAQRSMFEAHPCQRVFPLDSGHSPFLSRPRELGRQAARCRPRLAT